MMPPNPYVRALESLAPLALAASWDNVGVIVEGDRPVRAALLCIDLTEAVLAEAEQLDVDLIVAYHPPIFDGVRHLRRNSALGRTLLRITRAGRHVYSPHTALDAVPGGVNDWLVQALGPLADVEPIEVAATDPQAGAGRRAMLKDAVPWTLVAPQIAAHTGNTALQVAGHVDAVRSLAVCPGAGGSLLRKELDVDLLLTGEMRHHDILAAVGRGQAVVLTHHTNCERGYLPQFAVALERVLPGLRVQVSTQDRDPLQTWSAP
ncbi:MAG: Nif3-like dinuclear metal center hexameric protein [Myxococcota bacterium]